MSEYQHYEFLALDRSLTEEEMDDLRRYSSRAEISPTRFSVVYNYGSFKGSRKTFMERYFDAHVYVSNFGTFFLMLRLPGETLSQEEVEAYSGAGFAAQGTEGGWILTWEREGEPDYEWMEDDGWMSRLVPLRQEIERGDHRSLYIGWLRGVTMEAIEVDEEEPPVPPGLSALTPAQQALMEFLEVDGDLLEAAAKASPRAGELGEEAARMAGWVATLPIDEARHYLLLLLQGKGKDSERQLRRSFADSSRPAITSTSLQARRTVSELMELAEAAREARLQREETARLQKLEEQRRLRENYLRTMTADSMSHWQRAEKIAERGTAAAYDEVTALLVDLAEAAALGKGQREFSALLAQFRQTHVRRGALLRRLDAKKLR